MVKKIMTLCMIREGDKILLAMKKRGLGEGRWNGYGGKIKEGETIEQSAKRETLEEAGIIIEVMEKVGRLEFFFEGKEECFETHIFNITKYQGEILETEEMKPQWFNIKEIPFNQMWPDDQYWIPLYLEGKKFKGEFRFDKPSSKEYQSKILEQDIHETDSL